MEAKPTGDRAGVLCRGRGAAVVVAPPLDAINYREYFADTRGYPAQALAQEWMTSSTDARCAAHPDPVEVARRPGRR